MRHLLLTFVLLVLYGSFYPWHFVSPNHLFLLPVSLSDKRDLLLNFWLYVPLGALAFWTFSPLRVYRWILPVCLGLALSTFVEIVQNFIPSRVPSQGDILANALGTLGGMCLAAWAGSAPEFSSWRLRRSPETILLVCWTGVLLLPLFPVHGVYTLMMNVHSFQASPLLFTDLLVWTIAWLVVWELIPGAFVRDRYWIVIGVLLLLLPLRLFLIQRLLTKAELTAGLLSLAVRLVLQRRRIAPWAMVALILLAVGVRGLTPFEFSALPSAFAWIPLQGALGAAWQASLLVLVTKGFWYGSGVWALNRCGLTLAWAGISLATLLAGIEILQRYMPAHVPEITDPLLALVCAAAFGLAFRKRAGQPASSPYAPSLTT